MSEVRDLAKKIHEKYAPIEAASLRQVIVQSVGAGGACTVALDGVNVPAWAIGAAPAVGRTAWSVRQGGVLLVLGELGEQGTYAPSAHTHGVEAFSGARVYLAANQNIDSGVSTYVVWDAEKFDTDSYYNVSAPERLTAPTAGYYECNYGLRFFPDASSTIVYADVYSSRDGLIARNRPTEFSARLTGSHLGATGPVYLDAGEYMRLRVYHDDGGIEPLQGGTDWQTWMTITRLGS